jgi:hypothetical protein
MRLLRLLLRRCLGAIGVALAVYDVWRRLPRRQRRWLVAHGRRQGLRLATRAWAFVAVMIGR